MSTSILTAERNKQNARAAFYSANNEPELARHAANKADMAERGRLAILGRANEA